MPADAFQAGIVWLNVPRPLYTTTAHLNFAKSINKLRALYTYTSVWNISNHIYIHIHNSVGKDYDDDDDKTAVMITMMITSTMTNDSDDNDDDRGGAGDGDSTLHLDNQWSNMPVYSKPWVFTCIVILPKCVCIRTWMGKQIHRSSCGWLIIHG